MTADGSGDDIRALEDFIGACGDVEADEDGLCSQDAINITVSEIRGRLAETGDTIRDTDISIQ